jgi:hypothetical protein
VMVNSPCWSVRAGPLALLRLNKLAKAPTPSTSVKTKLQRKTLRCIGDSSLLV